MSTVEVILSAVADIMMHVGGYHDVRGWDIMTGWPQSWKTWKTWKTQVI